MLITLKEILSLAEKEKCAYGAFNGTDITCVRAVIEAAEAQGLPVILQHAQLHEPYAPLDLIAPVMLAAAKKAKVPVCVHLDHGEDENYIGRALELGFTGVMIDGSTLPYEQNEALTKRVVALAKKTGASVEAEIGAMGSRETGIPGQEQAIRKAVYTDPATAERFVKATGIDALACSFGTAHGLYLHAPQLDFSVLDGVRARIGTPLVMHGGSGVSAEDYRESIRRGIRKINYFTYMSKAGGEAMRQTVLATPANVPVYHFELYAVALPVMRENLAGAIRIFSTRDA